MKKVLLGIIAIVAITAKAQYGPYVIPNIDWVYNYGNTTTPSLSSVASEVDASKNVYVVGTYQGATKDIAVLKFDSLGNLLWSKLYNNGGDDYGNALAVNKSNGDVFVCGTSYGTATTLNDYAILKYNSSGTQIYAKRMNLANGNDTPNDIKIDASGNAYITGTAFNGTKKNDICTIKLTSTGTLTWTATYDGAATDDDYGVSLCLSSNGGTVYVAGNKGNGSGINDIVVRALKANSGGGTVWTYTVNGSANGNDVSNQIILAGANVVVCGQITNTTTNEDFTTIKINGSSGAQIFKKDYDSGNKTNYATSLCRDSTGNIAVVGRLNGTYNEYHTILYDSTGTSLWPTANVENTFISSTNIYPKISTDTIANHFYVVGEKMRTTNDIYAYQVTPTGNTSWREYYDRGGYDAGLSVSVNGYGQLYIAAITTNTGSGYDITTVKISQTPEYPPLDYNNANEPAGKNHYFYTNSGQILQATTTVQTATDVLYYTRFTNPQEFITTSNKVSFVLAKFDSTTVDSLHRVDLSFFHSNPLVQPHPFAPQTDAYLNYFLGQLGSNYTNIQGYSRMIFPNLYPSIDLQLYSNNQGLKMYWIVKPGASPSAIKMLWESASSTTLTGGQMKVNTTLGSFAFASPQAYWVDTSLTTYSTTCSYTTLGTDLYGVTTGTYNTSWPLVIQLNQGMAIPASTVLGVPWSTYWGGSGNDRIIKAKSDPNNVMWACGTTKSPNFPFAGNTTYSTIASGSYDGFVTKFDSGGGCYFSAFIGGSGTDQFNGLDAGFAGIYCVGVTTSSDITTQKPYFSGSAYTNSVFVGPLNTPQGDLTDGLITLLDANGINIYWASYYGGHGNDNLFDCQFDANGNLFIVGSSTSTDIPVVATGSAYPQTYSVSQQSQTPSGLVYDGIIVKLAALSYTMDWATYYGTYSNGGMTKVSDDELKGLDFDGSGNLYVSGSSGGVSLPGALNTPYTTNNTDGIVAKFTNDGHLTSSIYTFGNEKNNDLRVFNSRVHAGGYSSITFSATNSGAYYFNNTLNAGSPGGYYDGSLVITDLSLNCIHTTLLGGSDDDKVTGIDIDQNGIIYLAGGTKSSNFPTAFPVNCYTNTPVGSYDYFVSALVQNHTNLLWSTYLGSSSDESDFGTDASCSIDGNNNLTICGVTTSTASFLISGNGPPVPMVYQNGAGGQDGTITRFTLAAVQVQGIKEEKNDNAYLSLFPNPTSDRLTVSKATEDNKNWIYSVYNLIGQKVQEGILLSGGENNIINVSGLPNGAYIINFNNGIKAYNGKFIKVN